MQNSDLSSGFKISSYYGVSQLYESVKDPGQRTEERRDIGIKCEKKKKKGQVICNVLQGTLRAGKRRILSITDEKMHVYFYLYLFISSE